MMLARSRSLVKTVSRRSRIVITEALRRVRRTLLATARGLGAQHREVVAWLLAFWLLARHTLQFRFVVGGTSRFGGCRAAQRAPSDVPPAIDIAPPGPVLLPRAG
jgi:hypothetical protein